MTAIDTTTDPLATASHQLANFVSTRADYARRRLGFGWVGTATAPSTYQQLRGAFDYSCRTGEPLPVSNEFCESSIYPALEYNVMFRFWHDVSHVEHGLSFALEDELELALWHLGQLELAGHARTTLAHRTFEADLVGQVLLFALIRRFPIDQRTFVTTAHTEGLLPGLLNEIRRVS